MASNTSLAAYSAFNYPSEVRPYSVQIWNLAGIISTLGDEVFFSNPFSLIGLYSKADVVFKDPLTFSNLMSFSYNGDPNPYNPALYKLQINNFANPQYSVGEAFLPIQSTSLLTNISQNFTNSQSNSTTSEEGYQITNSSTGLPVYDVPQHSFNGLNFYFGSVIQMLDILGPDLNQVFWPARTKITFTPPSTNAAEYLAVVAVLNGTNAPYFENALPL